jgi:hypothetical protein
MTAQRQEENRRSPRKALPVPVVRSGGVDRTRRLRCAVLALFTGICVAICPSVGQSATTERIVVDRFSGLAIEGFDPVAYFVEGRPVRGLPDFEAMQGGAVWRFHNEGNRASFLDHPDIYGPQFGGYDPTDVARGVTLAGNPMFFVISGQRLYLFAREASRDAFAADPGRFLSQANARWPELERDLSQ